MQAVDWRGMHERCCEKCFQNCCIARIHGRNGIDSRKWGMRKTHLRAHVCCNVFLSSDDSGSVTAPVHARGRRVADCSAALRAALLLLRTYSFVGSRQLHGGSARAPMKLPTSLLLSPVEPGAARPKCADIGPGRSRRRPLLALHARPPTPAPPSAFATAARTLREPGPEPSVRVWRARPPIPAARTACRCGRRVSPRRRWTSSTRQPAGRGGADKRSSSAFQIIPPCENQTDHAVQMPLAGVTEPPPCHRPKQDRRPNP